MINSLEKAKLLLQITSQQQAAKNAALQEAFENAEAVTESEEKALAAAILSLDIMNMPKEAIMTIIKEAIIDNAQEFLDNTLEFLKELYPVSPKDANISYAINNLKEFEKIINGWKDSETDSFIAQNQRQKEIYHQIKGQFKIPTC